MLYIFYSDLFKQRRSWIWSYFRRISATLAQCKICERNICHGGNATGNMNRHLKIIHNKTSGMYYLQKLVSFLIYLRIFAV